MGSILCEPGPEPTGRGGEGGEGERGGGGGGGRGGEGEIVIMFHHSGVVSHSYTVCSVYQFIRAKLKYHFTMMETD